MADGKNGNLQSLRFRRKRKIKNVTCFFLFPRRRILLRSGVSCIRPGLHAHPDNKRAFCNRNEEWIIDGLWVSCPLERGFRCWSNYLCLISPDALNKRKMSDAEQIPENRTCLLPTRYFRNLNFQKECERNRLLTVAPIADLYRVHSFGSDCRIWYRIAWFAMSYLGS